MQLAKYILRSLWLIAISLVLVPAAANAKCVLCVGGVCGVIGDLNCSDLILAPSDICRDALGIATVETVSPSARYAIVDGNKYPLMSDEAQARLDQLVRETRGNLQSMDIGKELAPIIAARGPISEARVKAIIGGTENCYAPPCPGEAVAAKPRSEPSVGIVEDGNSKGCTGGRCSAVAAEDRCASVKGKRSTYESCRKAALAVDDTAGKVTVCSGGVWWEVTWLSVVAVGRCSEEGAIRH